MLVDVDVEIRVVVSVISVEGSIVVAPSPKNADQINVN